MSVMWMLPAFIYLCIAEAVTGSPCITPSDQPGDCRTLETCAPLHELVKEKVLTNVENLNLLQKSHCGFEEITRKPKVCCPCVTLSNITLPGQCMDVQNCEHIRTRLSSTLPVPQQYMNYVYSLRCQGSASFSVCCGPPPSFEPVLTPISAGIPLPLVPGNSATIAAENKPQPVSETRAQIAPVNSTSITSACSTSNTPITCVTLGNITVPGQCIDVFDCEHITTKLARKPVPQQYKDYVYSIRCAGSTSFSVCCEPPPSFEPVPTPIPVETPLAHVPETRASIAPVNRPLLGPEGRAPITPVNRPPLGLEDRAPIAPVNTASCTMSALPPNPASGCCGCSGPSPKIIGGTNAGLDQYPWLALIEYEKEHEIKLLCGGALISGRYVLTAAHCVVGPRFRTTVPKNVRLGEYDISLARDCDIPEGGDDEDEVCTSDPVIIPIIQIIGHLDYKPLLRSRHNDIALLRLAHIPEYTDYVRPICLPTVDSTASFGDSEMVYAAGWGAVSDKLSSSNVKQQVKLPYKTFEICQQAYNVSIRQIKLWERQMCAGGEAGKDTCKGDSGGPLMHYREQQGTRPYFEVIGVVSFGVTPCGMENVPGVYTKVYEYLPWIYSNIQS